MATVRLGGIAYDLRCQQGRLARKLPLHDPDVVRRWILRCWEQGCDIVLFAGSQGSLLSGCAFPLFQVLSDVSFRSTLKLRSLRRMVAGPGGRVRMGMLVSIESGNQRPPVELPGNQRPAGAMWSIWINNSAEISIKYTGAQVGRIFWL